MCISWLQIYLLHSCSVDICQVLGTGYSRSLGWDYHSHTSWCHHCYMWTVLGPPYRIHHTEGHGSSLNRQFWSSRWTVQHYASHYMLSLLWDQIHWAPGQSGTCPIPPMYCSLAWNYRQQCRTVLSPVMINNTKNHTAKKNLVEFYRPQLQLSGEGIWPVPKIVLSTYNNEAFLKCDVISVLW